MQLSSDRYKLNHPLYRVPGNLYLLKIRFSSLYRLPMHSLYLIGIEHHLKSTVTYIHWIL